MKVFISYGRGDALEFARKLATWLKAEGITPWLDVDEGIPIGSPFDIQIEVGIEGSDLLIAVLSPWSLRPEGFCRNELLFAQARKRPIIPVRIADVTPPIQIISLNYLDACDNPDGIFGELSKVIQQVAQSGRMTLHDWPALMTARPWWADRRQLNFEEELARHGDSFTGREWLFAQIREWAAQPDSRLLLVTAEAGFGKSAVSAQLTTRLNVRGVHFCSRSQVESCKPAAWLTGLAYQLAAQFPDYRAKLDLSSPDWNQPGESLFRALVTEPLREVTVQSPVEEPWVFVVDALDESVAEAGRALADLLTDSAERIPDWLRIIVTSRPDENIIAQFKRDGVMSKHLDAEGTPNLADVTHYITERVAGLEHAGVIDRQTGTADRLAHVARGNFLFAKLTLDSLMDADPACRLSLDEMGSLPSKLGGLYHSMFRKRFRDPEIYEREILPLLDCLIAARGPLPRDLLSAAACLDARAFQRALRALSQFLGTGPTGYRVFHQSLADWLTDEKASGELAASLPQGRENLAAACWATYQHDPARMPAYALLHSPTHLVESGRWGDLCQILTDLLFIQAKCEAGMVHDLMRDYNKALATLPEFREENERNRRHDEAMFVYHNTLRDYAREHCAWLQPNKRGDPGAPAAAPPYPRLPSELQARGGDAIPEERSNRAARLRHFANFVSNHIRFLTDYPDHSLPLALNHAGKGPVTDLAELQIGDCERLCLRRNPRPPAHPLRPQCLRTLEGHSDMVRSVSVRPDGRHAVSGSSDHTLRVWDLEAGACLRVIEAHRNEVRSVCLCPDSRHAISGSSNHTVRVWDLETGTCLRTLEGHRKWVRSVSVSPDGRHAISGSSDHTVRVWDLETGTCLHILEGHSNQVTSVCVSPNGRHAISGSHDRTLRVWDLDTGACVRTLEGHSKGVLSVSVSPDGLRAVSGSHDRTLRVWDLETGACVRTLEGHSDMVRSVSVGPDGRHAVSGSSDHTVRVWDLETGACIRELEGHSNEVRSASLSPDGRHAISGSEDNTLRVWDLEAGICPRIIEGHRNDIRSVSLSPDHRYAISGSWDHTMRVWDLETGTCIRILDSHSAGVNSVSVGPDSRRAISGSADHTVRVWDLETGACLHKLEGHSNWVESVSVSLDGRLAVSGSDDKTVRVWNLEIGNCLHTLKGHRNSVYSVSISPDCRRAISGSSDHTVRVWNLETGACLHTLVGHSNEVNSVCVSPDGRLAISGSWDHALRVWDLDTGICLRTLVGHSNQVTSVSVGPDGRRAISGSSDHTVRVWDLETGTCLRTLEGHSDDVTSVGLSPDGRCAISGSWDRTLRVWELETNRRPAIYHAYSRVFSVLFSPSNSRIVCGTEDGHMHFLTPVNFPPAGPAILTATNPNHARCPCCARDFTPKTGFIAAIRSHTATLRPHQSPCLDLPDSAFDDPRLLTTCPHCAKPLKFNPFFIHNFA